jgi:hypothetical protein
MANDDQGRLKNAVLTKFCYVAIALSAKAEQLHKSAAPRTGPAAHRTRRSASGGRHRHHRSPAISRDLAGVMVGEILPGSLFRRQRRIHLRAGLRRKRFTGLLVRLGRKGRIHLRAGLRRKRFTGLLVRLGRKGGTHFRAGLRRKRRRVITHWVLPQLVCAAPPSLPRVCAPGKAGLCRRRPGLRRVRRA